MLQRLRGKPVVPAAAEGAGATLAHLAEVTAAAAVDTNYRRYLTCLCSDRIKGHKTLYFLKTLNTFFF